VTTTHTFANTWLAWRLGAFQMEHPDLAVRMTTSNFDEKIAAWKEGRTPVYTDE